MSGVITWSDYDYSYRASIPLVLVSLGVWRDIGAQARLRAGKPFHRKRHKRMRGK